jgi:DNA polymerase-3 subunit alpha
MGLTMLPPDINEGEESFSVGDRAAKTLRYALTAIKGVGAPIIAALVAEREERGPFTNLKDFIVRMTSAEARSLNKKALESFIKAGALDSLPGTRKQHMCAYVQILENIQHDKKSNLAGQLTLFDVADEETKEDFEMQMPDVGEYDKEFLLTFEKEVLGIYLSGHPLEENEEMWRFCTTNTCADFYLDAETGEASVYDDQFVVIGGLIAGKTNKTTRNNEMMCFLQIEDLAGSCEVIVFPKSYEKYKKELEEGNKIFVRGRVSLEEEKDAKLKAETIVSFAAVPAKLWLQFADKDAYEAASEWLYQMLELSPGKEKVIVYLKATEQKRELPPENYVRCDRALLDSLIDSFGAENVKVTWEKM